MSPHTGEHLTAQDDFGMLETSKALWGRSAPCQSGKKGDCSFQGVLHCAPEMCLPARAAAAHKAVDSLGRFFASEIQNLMRCKMTDKSFKTFCNGLALYVSHFLKESELEVFRKKDDHQLLGYGMALELLLKAGYFTSTPEEKSKQCCKLIPFTPALQKKAMRGKTAAMAKEFYENH